MTEQDKQKNKELKDFFEKYYQYIDSGVLGMGAIRKMEEDGRAIAYSKLVRDNPEYVSKEYLSHKDGYDAYQKILDLGVTAQEALEFVAVSLGKPLSWVEDIKDNNYLHAASVVKAHDNHPTQKSMMQDGTMDRVTLKSSKTANHQLRRLHNQVRLHKKLTELDVANGKLESEVKDLKLQGVIQDSSIDRTMDALGLSRLTDKDKASKLKVAGFTQKEIWEYLGISRSTMKSWWKEI